MARAHDAGGAAVTAAVVVVVVAGMGVALATAVGRGFDAAAATILAVAAALGALGIAVARKAGGGRVGPARCASCGGLVSPNAPYCKHCGAPA